MWITGVCQGVPQDDRHGVSQSSLSHLGKSVHRPKRCLEERWQHLECVDDCVEPFAKSVRKCLLEPSGEIDTVVASMAKY